MMIMITKMVTKMVSMMLSMMVAMMVTLMVSMMVTLMVAMMITKMVSMMLSMMVSMMVTLMVAMMRRLMVLQFCCVLILVSCLIEPLHQERKLIEVLCWSPHHRVSLSLRLSLHLSLHLLHRLVSDLPEPLQQEEFSLARQTEILLVQSSAADRAHVVEEENGCTEDDGCDPQTFRFFLLPYSLLDCFPGEKPHSRDQFFSLRLLLRQTLQPQVRETVIFLSGRLVWLSGGGDYYHSEDGAGHEEVEKTVEASTPLLCHPVLSPPRLSRY